MDSEHPAILPCGGSCTRTSTRPEAATDYREVHLYIYEFHSMKASFFLFIKEIYRSPDRLCQGSQKNSQRLQSLCGAIGFNGSGHYQTINENGVSHFRSARMAQIVLQTG
jgi:hypothetical protein